MEILENHATYMSRFTAYPLDDRRLIDFAYRLAKDAHRGQTRDSGIRYFEHLRAVSTIIFDEFNLRESYYFMSAILHDAGEDTPILGSSKIQTYPEWRDEASFLLNRIFGPKVEEMVLAVTHPYIDGVTVLDKQRAEALSLANLSAASPEAKILKMSDRLHNLRSLDGIEDLARRKRKIEETITHYFPIFESVLPYYPEVTRYATAEMRRAMANL